MAWEYRDIIVAHGQRLQAERAEALAMLESGRLNEDATLVNSASDAIMRIDRDYQQLGQYANQFVQDQQRAAARAPSNRYGLNRAEEEAAIAAIPDRNDVRLTREQKLQSYATQKQKYLAMKANGSYSTGQGNAKGSW
jgi:hypothetical protein